MYKEITDHIYKKVCCIVRIVDGANIPLDPANTDYQAFLAWKAEGNEPEPADEIQNS